MKQSKPITLCLVLVLCAIIQISFAADPLPQSVINQMASRQMRYHHFLWHQLRDNWNRFSESTKNEFQKIGWAPPNPSRDSRGQSIMNNYAGEDFLYMHRDMIARVNRISSFKVRGWTTVPAPGDREYPVPPPFKQGSTNNALASYKTDDHYYRSIQPAERTYKDPARLRKMTLNELGKKIETGIHNSMHMRWAAYSSVGYRGGGNLNNGVPNINKQWDNPAYNWLVDTYSSHVNPIFWKLHGWIDDRIEDWRRANGLSSIRWRGTWTGGPMSSLSSAMKEQLGRKSSEEEDPEFVGDVLQKAMEIFRTSGVKESSLTDPVILAPVPKKFSSCRKPKKGSR